MRHLMK